MLPSHARRNGSLPSSLIGDTQFRAGVALDTGARFPSRINQIKFPCHHSLSLSLSHSLFILTCSSFHLEFA